MCRSLRALAENLEEKDGAGDRRIKARNPPDHGDADIEVDPSANRWGESLPLAPDHETDRPPKIGATVILGGLGLGAHHTDPS